MKKTLIALMALASVAMADTTTVTLGSWFEKDNESFVTLDAVIGKNRTEADLLLESDRVSQAKSSAIFDIYTGDLLLSGVKVGDTVQISSIQICSGDADTNYVGPHEKRTLTITLNNATYTSDQQTAEITSGKYGTLTYTFSGDNVFEFVVGDTLTASINAEEGVAHTQFGTFQGQSGVSNLTHGNLSGWQAAVKLNGTVVVPEPATATLSLLALAGLAARRRRK